MINFKSMYAINYYEFGIVLIIPEIITETRVERDGECNRQRQRFIQSRVFDHIYRYS